MKLVIQSTMVFLGTLAAAALVTFGEPGSAEVQMAHQPQPEMVASLLGLDQ